MGYVMTPPHITFFCGIFGFDGLAEDESGKNLAKAAAPKYFVYPVDWASINPNFVSDEPCIIYFVESFDASHPPENLGIPGSYQSPELILDKTVAFGCDLWALGCTLFEIRTGRKLFSPFDDDADDCLDGMVQNLEKLPESWWSTTCEIRSGAKTKPGRIVNTQEAEELHLVADKEKRTGFIVAIHPSVANGARSLQEKLAPGLWYLDGPVGIHHHLVGEIEKFADLLVKLLKFDLKVPLTATAAQDHEWFRI